MDSVAYSSHSSILPFFTYSHITSHHITSPHYTLATSLNTTHHSTHEQSHDSLSPSPFHATVGGGKYAFRIYLTEGSGIVLGANFMTGMNVIFDPPNKGIRIINSLCNIIQYYLLTLYCLSDCLPVVTFDSRSYYCVAACL